VTDPSCDCDWETGECQQAPLDCKAVAEVVRLRAENERLEEQIYRVGEEMAKDKAQNARLRAEIKRLKEKSDAVR
jgi:hypothetical protein